MLRYIGIVRLNSYMTDTPGVDPFGGGGAPDPFFYSFLIKIDLNIELLVPGTSAKCTGLVLIKSN